MNRLKCVGFKCDLILLQFSRFFIEAVFGVDLKEYLSHIEQYMIDVMYVFPCLYGYIRYICIVKLAYYSLNILPICYVLFNVEFTGFWMYHWMVKRRIEDHPLKIIK